ncbi:hypothetical protein C8J57DRAFT_1309296 [Mycena rebaudengoi]|nr:hypothetical protein C8J57DRAFT_1309296 [Mycena rebaudengoi]
MLRTFIRNLACRSSGYDEPLYIEVDHAPYLPLELWHYIIGSVEANMLAACSLVCSSWIAPARARMFWHISISLCNADRFGRLFTQPTRTTFAAYVREIDLEEEIARDFWTAYVLPKFIAHFPQLTTLNFFGRVPQKPLHPVFEVITHLDLSNVWCIHLGQLSTFISNFPRLHTLKLTQDDGPFMFNFDHPAACAPPRGLRTLDLDNAHILRWITAGAPYPSIDNIRLEITTSEMITAVESIRSLSTNLRVLDLNLAELAVGAYFLANRHLELNSGLRILRIQADHSHAAQVMLKILSYIDTSSLEEISLEFAIPYLDSPVMASLPWSELDKALAALPVLRRLTVAKVLVSPHGWKSRINQRDILLEAVNRMPLCRVFGVGLLPDSPRPRRRAAGSGRPLADYYGY